MYELIEKGTIYGDALILNKMQYDMLPEDHKKFFTHKSKIFVDRIKTEPKNIESKSNLKKVKNNDYGYGVDGYVDVSQSVREAGKKVIDRYINQRKEIERAIEEAIKKESLIKESNTQKENEALVSIEVNFDDAWFKDPIPVNREVKESKPKRRKPHNRSYSTEGYIYDREEYLVRDGMDPYPNELAYRTPVTIEMDESLDFDVIGDSDIDDEVDS